MIPGNYTYADLTSAQKTMVNGCGSSFLLAIPFRLPRFLFPRISKACDCHDIGYQLSADDITEKWALDAQLVEDFLEWARAGNRWYTRQWRFKIAQIVWWALDTKLSELCWRAAQR